MCHLIDNLLRYQVLEYGNVLVEVPEPERHGYQGRKEYDVADSEAEPRLVVPVLGQYHSPGRE